MPSSIFLFFVETGSHHVARAGLKLLASSDRFVSDSQRAGIRCLSLTQPVFSIKNIGSLKKFPLVLTNLKAGFLFLFFWTKVNL